jgi:hypothetical protein
MIAQATKSVVYIAMAATTLIYAPQGQAAERRFVPERCETITEWVLVNPRRTERRWEPELVVVSYDQNGRAIRTVTPGCWRDVEIAARYEPRNRTVTIPAHWENIPAVPPAKSRVAVNNADCTNTVVIDRRGARTPRHDPAPGTQARINTAGLAAANQEYQAATGQSAIAVQQTVRTQACDNGSSHQAVINPAGLAAANQAYREATGQGLTYNGDRAK